MAMLSAVAESIAVVWMPPDDSYVGDRPTCGNDRETELTYARDSAYGGAGSGAVPASG
jgi:hypothetical protein